MTRSNIGSILLKAGKITIEELDKALEKQRGGGSSEPIGELLVKMKYTSHKDIALGLSEQLNIPYVEPGTDVRPTQEEVSLIPEAIARRFHVIPLKRENGTITVGMKDPLDVEAIDTIRSLTKLEVARAVSTDDKILELINKFYRDEEYIESNLKDIADVENGKSDAAGMETIDAEQLRILANDVPVVRLVNLLLLQAIRDRASDIHFEPAEHDVTVRIRVDGRLMETTPPPKNMYKAVVTRIKILSNMNITERRLPQDGRFKFKVRDKIIDVRVSSLPEAYGEKLVLRILDRDAMIADMKDVGLEPDMLKKFQKILQTPHGIVLLTGPTGSGKTTTLYGALNFLKAPFRNIQTVEDPIEYLIKGINQMQVRSQINLTFANALRSILRQDPNIIMIGEIRDLETAEIAMRASLTGHLVLSTLHTNDSPSALNRLKDIGVEPYLIASTVNLLISQRLVRVICPKCKEETAPLPSALAIVKSVYPDAVTWKYYRGKGCGRCADTGYRGRTAIFEFLEMSNALREAFLRGDSGNALRDEAIEHGMTTLLADGFNKVRRGITTIEEVLSVCPPIEL
jgi:type IV pilus assembly protein PilB